MWIINSDLPTTSVSLHEPSFVPKRTWERTACRFVSGCLPYWVPCPKDWVKGGGGRLGMSGRWCFRARGSPRVSPVRIKAGSRVSKGRIQGGRSVAPPKLDPKWSRGQLRRLAKICQRIMQAMVGRGKVLSPRQQRLFQNNFKTSVKFRILSNILHNYRCCYEIIGIGTGAIGVRLF